VILSLIGKWLNAGAMQDGVVLRTDEGTPQGGPISCVLSNLYLHHSLDLWFEKKFKPQCQGEAIWCDSSMISVGSFQNGHGRRKNFSGSFGSGLSDSNLYLAEEKTRILQFGRFAAVDRAGAGMRPETFEFWASTACLRGGSQRQVRSDPHSSVRSCRKFLARVHEWLRKQSHWKRRDQQQHLTANAAWLLSVLRPFHHCERKLQWVRSQVQLQWNLSLRRRSQRHRLYWSYLLSRAWFELPYPRTLHQTV